MKHIYLSALFCFVIVTLAGCGHAPIEQQEVNYQSPKPTIDRILLKKCKIGVNPLACKQIAQIYEGHGHHRRAYRYYLMSCNLQLGAGCYHVGRLDGNHKKIKHARLFFQKGCKLKSGEACLELGMEQESKGNVDTAFSYFELACDYNNPDACNKLGLYFYGQDKLEKSYHYLGKSCRYRNAVGCFNLGLIHYFFARKRTAEGFFYQGCRLGDNLSCYNLACLYSMKSQSTTALKYLEEALKYGFNDWKKLDVDEDLGRLRSHPSYPFLVKKYKSAKKRKYRSDQLPDRLKITPRATSEKAASKDQTESKDYEDWD